MANDDLPAGKNEPSEIDKAIGKAIDKGIDKGTGKGQGAFAAESDPAADARRHEWPLWEVFVRGRHGMSHRHVGSLHAADAQMALKNARDVYTRRREGVSIWVVKSRAITASTPADKEAFFEPADNKLYRHPSFFDIPDEAGAM